MGNGAIFFEDIAINPVQGRLSVSELVSQNFLAARSRVDKEQNGLR
jgi:hypothetical protein